MPEVPVVLAFDTSTEWLSVALDCGEGRAFERHEPGGARASQRLLPLVHELLGEAGLSLRDVGLIGFGAGPGAFTGLRASCAAAQGLARGLGCAVVPVPTLLAVAASAGDADDGRPQQVLVANDARMGELYWACARNESSAAAPAPAWRLASPSRVQSAVQAAAAWVDAFGACPDAQLVLCGNAWNEHRAALADALGAGWSDALGRARTVAPRAAAVARLALAAHARGESVAAEQARPLYVRDKVALTSAERAAAKAVA